MNLIPWRNKREERNGGTLEHHPLSRLRDEMDRAFERIWQDPWGMSAADLFQGTTGFGPRLNLAESENDVTVTAELPGVDPEDVDINVADRVLTIHGEKKEEKEDKKRNYHYVERRYGTFHRTIQMPSSADPDNVDASYKNGILTITLQKRPDAKPKRIAVKTN